ncbi:MAG TPA: sulfatase [Chthoniobacteraceae bacterium]|nr:sulfatase [Chthoniobacteraceae bacterium]
MKRILLFLLLLLQATVFAVDDRPNIVWVVGEDMGPELGSYGDAQAITPSSDRLAKEGARFTRCFTHAPVCAPSRHGLITGQYPIKTGAHHMRSTLINPPVTFTRLLRDGGYTVAWPGKTDFNFKEPKEFADSREKWWTMNAPLKEPFFAYANFTQSHESQVRNDGDKYAANTRRLTAAQRHDPAKIVLPPFWPDAPEVREEVTRYYDLCTSVDYDLGDVLEWLEKQGFSDNTVVIFFGDHGRGMPRFKRWCYDTGTHTPLIVRWPGKVQPGTVREDIIEFLDLPATALSLAGLTVPKDFDGQVFLGPNAASPRKYAHAARDYMDETFDRIRSVRDSRYRYVRNFAPDLPYAQVNSYMEIGKTMQVWRKWNAEGKLNEMQNLFFTKFKPKEELYDTESDPWELKNIAEDPRFASKLVELRAECDAWIIRTQDKGAISVDRLVTQGVITERAGKYAERLKRGADAVRDELKK